MRIQFKLILVGCVAIALLMAVVGVVQMRASAQINDQLTSIDRLFDARTSLVDPAVHEIGELSAVVEKTYATLLEFAILEVAEPENDKDVITIEDEDHEEIIEEEDGHGHSFEDVNDEQFDTDVTVRLDALHNQFDHSLEQLDAAAAAAAAAAADIDPLVGEAIAHIAKELEPVQEIHEFADRLYEEQFNTLDELVYQGNHEGAKAYVQTTVRSTADEIRSVLTSIKEHLDQEQVATAEIIEGTIHNANAAAAAARILFIGVLVAVLLAIAMGVFVSRSVARPLKELQHVAAKIIAGDYSVRAKVSGKDEIGQLASAFNAMTESLVAAKRLPENILRSMKDSLFVVDTKGKITEVNDAALEVLGYTKEELVGQEVSKVFGKVGAHSGAESKAEAGGGKKKKPIRYVVADDQEGEN